MSVNLGPRTRIYQEANESRIVAMTPDGAIIAYKGEVVMIVVGKSLEECSRVLCPMLRGEPEAAK